MTTEGPPAVHQRSGGLAGVPLRVRLVAALLVLLAAGLAVSGAVAVRSLRGYLLSRIDSQLIDFGRGQPGLRVPAAGRGGGQPDGDNQLLFYTLLSDVDGTPVYATASKLSPPDLPALSGPYVLSTRGRPFTAGSADGSTDWRVRVRAVVDQQGTPGFQAVALPIDDVTDTVRRLVLIDVVVSLVVLTALGGVAFAVVRSSLRPLVEVERTAGAIAAGDLSRRVDEGSPRTEVGRLARALNSMLAQIERAFGSERAARSAAAASEQRMRQFVADASHELRTPLTSIRGFAELYRQGAVPEPADVDRVMGRIENESTRMGALVDELLLLARLDEHRALAMQPVDLLALAADAVHDAHAVDPERPLALEAAGDAPPVVLGDEDRLRQVLANLLANARTHTPPGTPVTVSVTTTTDRAVLSVADRGPGLTPEQQSRVFERFYRADAARTRAAGGSGLGLSIVASLVEAHHGRVGVAVRGGGGATFLVELPLAETQPPEGTGTGQTGTVSEAT